MKKFLLFFLALFILGRSASAQWVPITDPAFLNFLQTNYPSCVTDLGVGDWNLNTTCSEIVNEDSLTIMNIHTVDLTLLPYFVNLTYLKLDGLGIPFWGTPPSLPVNLEKLIYNNIDASDPIPLNGNLRYLEAINTPSNAFFTSLPNSLRYYNCSNSMLRNIPPLPAQLDTLICKDQRGVAPATNLLTSLPILPSTLKYLDCSGAALTALPTLPPDLRYLNCSRNYVNLSPQDFQKTLGSLPPLPASLEYLNVSSNKLTSLPPLPAGLKYLNIANQRDYEDDLIFSGSPNIIHPGISQLPDLPATLETLIVSNNALQSLPDLPASITYLDVSYNARPHGQDPVTEGLTSIGTSLPPNITYLNVSYTLVECIPHLPASVLQVLSESSRVVCLPNSGSYTTQPSRPLCSPVNNINQCVSSPVIAGTLYYDNNSNGVRDASENPRANVEVQTSSGLSAYSNRNGYFEVTGDTGTNVITVLAPTPYVSVPATATYIFHTFDTLVNNAFALQPTVSLDSLRVSIVNDLTPRPGFDFGYTVNYENVGTTVLSSNMQISYDAANLAYVDATIPGVTISGGVLTVPAINTTPGDRRRFSISFTVNTTAPLGDTVLAIVSSTVNAGVVKDSIFNVISGSYDPNDKNATPVLTPAQVADGTFINYLVRFQNTGTDTAFNIVVTDTLDTRLDASSFQMLDASHPAIIKRDGRALTFEFINIQLPDSNVNEPLSHGFIKFRAKPLSTLVDGDVVNNLANIYFDYNSPIITNLAVTSIAAPNSCFTLSATTTAASCAGVSNGSITVTVNGGTAPFIYSITGVAPQSSPTFTALAVGTYAIAVRDANSCMVSVMATVDAAGGFTATGASTPASCAGVNNGSITVTPNGGTAPLTYSLDGGTPQAAGTFTGVAAGQHTVTVTDASGCTRSVSITVSAGFGFTAATSSTAATCGLQDGVITVLVNGGTAPYNYSLNAGTSQTSSIFNNVGAGTHVVSITDANGCTVSLTVALGETPITATLTTTNSTCSSGGTIEITGSNGTAPFLYSINGGAMQSSAIFDNLIAGSYVVLVQDANMCTYTETVTINVTPGTVTPTVSIIASSSTICEGEPVTFTATATNGGANPQYQWLVNGANAGTNAATLTINPTSDADVSVVLTSNDACASPATATSNTVTVAVNPSQAPSITISGNTTVDQGASATITSSVVNEGTTPSYQWQDSTSTHTWTNIAGAINSTIDYTPQQTGDGIRAILTSTASCISSSTAISNALYFTVETITPPRMRLYPNPVRSVLTIENNSLTQWVSADILDDNGRKVSTFRNSNAGNEVRMDVSMLMSGIYFIRLIDRNGKPEYFKFIKQ